MSRLRLRTSSVVGPWFAMVAITAATVVALLGLLSASFSGAGVAQVLVTAAALGVFTAVLAGAGRNVVQPLPVSANPSRVPGAVAAPSAYWCALDAPVCPQRPRAPGLR